MTARESILDVTNTVRSVAYPWRVVFVAGQCFVLFCFWLVLYLLVLAFSLAARVCFIC